MRDDEKSFGDVVYEVWRRGGNPDLVNRDDVADCTHDQSTEEIARGIMERSRRKREPSHG